MKAFLFFNSFAANLAWRRLSTDIQREVTIILNISNATEVEYFGSPMAVVANWADQVRRSLPWSSSLHWIDVRDDLIEGGCHYQYNASTNNDDYSIVSSPSNLCDFEYSRDCVDDVCAAGAILNYSTHLIDKQEHSIVHKGERRIQSDNTGRSTASSSPHLLRRSLMKDEMNSEYNFPAPSDSDSSIMRQALMFVIQ